MTYQITIEDDKATALISFLEELSFVKVKEVKQAEHTLINDPLAAPAYFGACPEWEPDAEYLRNAANSKRLTSW